MRTLSFASIFMFALLTITFFSACEKDEKTEIPNEITVNQNNIESGSLTVTLKDGSGSAIADQIVYLYEGMSVFELLKTNSSGVANFGDLLSGTYSIYCEDVSANDKIYKINKNIQVLTGKSKDISINVEEYVGTLTVNVEDNWTSEALANVNVKLIRYSDYQEFFTGNYSDVISYAVFSGSTNSNGQVIFANVPTESYKTIVYNSTDTTSSSFFSISLYQEKEIDQTL